MRFHIEIDNYKYKIFKVEDLKSCLLEILQIVLSKQSGFMSINVNTDETSIVMRDDLCKDIVTLSIYPIVYRMMKVEASCSSNESGINEVGILAELTKRLMRYKIPILVVSSFNNNYVLYPEEYQSTMDELCKSELL